MNMRTGKQTVVNYTDSSYNKLANQKTPSGKIKYSYRPSVGFRGHKKAKAFKCGFKTSSGSNDRPDSREANDYCSKTNACIGYSYITKKQSEKDKKKGKQVEYKWCALTLKPSNCVGTVTWKCRRGKQSLVKDVFYEKFNDRFLYLSKQVFTTGPNKGKDARCKKGIAPSHKTEQVASAAPTQKAEDMQLCVGYSCQFYKTAQKIRRNPMSFVPVLEKQMTFFKGKTLDDPSITDPFAYSRGNVGDAVMTFEGKPAW